MQAAQTWNYQRLAEAFHARGLAMPRASLVTISMPVLTHFLANGPFITTIPRSVAHFNSLKVLPVDLPVRPWPVTMVTLKNRTLSPVVERFIECAREVARLIAGRPGGYPAHRRNPNVEGQVDVAIVLPTNVDRHTSNRDGSPKGRRKR